MALILLVAANAIYLAEERTKAFASKLYSWHLAFVEDHWLDIRSNIPSGLDANDSKLIMMDNRGRSEQWRVAFTGILAEGTGKLEWSHVQVIA